jgi:hypothetical protein
MKDYLPNKWEGVGTSKIRTSKGQNIESIFWMIRTLKDQNVKNQNVKNQIFENQNVKNQNNKKNLESQKLLSTSDLF